jgi:hypothetical protein
VAKGTFLTKEDLVRRVALRLPRYGVNPSEQSAEEWVKNHIDEWMKQSLALAAERGPNRGQKRTYTYSFRHYRRVLQLVRFYGDGRTATADLHIQLFLRGYSGFSQALRDAVLYEYRKFRSQLISTLRSKQFTNLGPVTEARQRQIIKSMGPLDERLEALALPPETYFGIARLTLEQDPDESAHKQSFSDPILLEFLRSMFGGFLDDGDESEAETKIERLIRLSAGEAYERARDNVRKMIFATEFFAQGGDPQVFSTIAGSFRQREFSALFIVFALREVAKPI